MTSLQALAARRGDDEQGFTLIELMVVVLIIAILIAIAIPTFLGARQRAQDRAAQSDLRNGLTAEKTEYTDTQVYDANATGTMKGIESSLNWSGTPAPSASRPTLTVNVANVVGPPAVTGAVVCLSEQSKSGSYFNIVDVAAGANAGTYFSKGNAVIACTNDSIVGGMATSW